MSKPILEIQITSLDEKTSRVRAVIDSGSFFTIIREDRVPSRAVLVKRAAPLDLRAAQGGKLTVTGEISLVLQIEGKMISDSVLVSPNLVQDMLVGAKTMQAWDISIQNSNGHTKVVVGHDLRDPEITEVD